ncbi:cobyrinate a,c-diamide synthase [Butyrivibrio sp. AE3004]|uniref:cobyrinate a,c-diamide synthase n=1 Tax=Butyrivibrio sp. AE3004 TaxID=1506994 RepID=UPI0004943930|nr:cobyrinate a,c-diamide synthase [Butyrivibrio sp. AE3004]
MNSISAKRIMIAAPGSGSGKTLITCALLEALSKRGLNPVSFKCGPDYIDPMFHNKILGIESRNLDTFFSGTSGVERIVAEKGDRYAVIEGVMGLYDGLSTDGVEGSAYEVAAALSAPIILVVDASGVGRTIISLIKGMLLDDDKKLIKGIILNKISEGFYKNLKPVMEAELYKMRQDVRVLGFFPKNASVKIESRHLGLKLPGEIDDIKRMITLAADMLEKSVNLEEVISIMESAGAAPGEEGTDLKEPASGDFKKEEADDKLTLAVAYDDAFCFYYRENLELFEKMGVKLRYFSPLRDEKLPEGCDGILLGGGYPENYLKELSENKPMLASIKWALDKGIPSLAECGGFMYLHREIRDTEGKSYKMVGAVDGECFYTGHLVRFGYMKIEDINSSAAETENDNDGNNKSLRASLVGMKGHEFHYYDSTANGDSYVAKKPYKDVRWDCMTVKNNGFWGFPHFYYNSNIEFIENFIDRMKEVAKV